jgi:hypothetical protein
VAVDERTDIMAEYLLAIYNDEDAAPALDADVSRDYAVFMDKWAHALRGGASLERSGTATTVRGAAVTDGVFVELKEVFGGYFVIEAADLDEAIAIASDVPCYGGGVEIRPIHLRSGM